MFSKALSSFVLLIAALAHVSSVVSKPVDVTGLGESARRILARSTPAAPRFVVYSDAWVSGETGPPAVSEIDQIRWFYPKYWLEMNTLAASALSFLLASGSADQATEWETLTAAQRTTIKSQYAAAGISLIVSAFGSTEAPTSSGFDPTDTANTIAAWVKEYDLDGVDVDYEDFNAMNAQDGSAENWLTTFTTQLRNQLPSGQYIITHAPVAPWFSPGKYTTGAYLTVDKNVGSLIDWYNIQFYNQGTSEYTTCAGLLTESSSTWPQSAVFQIAASGVSLNKIVIGKPATTSDANNGYIAPATLATCLEQAKSQGWSAGAMVWEFPDAAASWISTVRSDSWPVSGAAPPPPTTTTSTTGTSSPTGGSGGSGSCAGVAAWVSSTAYVGGDEVTYNGDLWTAKWWSEGDTPGGSAGDWTNDGAC
ncbi:hypothetical protein M0805_005290 [Coniferiporia weirii]|nr:hypothetical protein M0805_005290 [Coniferiporia weirii]